MTASTATLAETAKPRDNKRPQVLDSADRYFREQGYAASSMRDIAAAAGMKAGSMYYYFASKEELLVAVHEEGIRRITKAVNAALAGPAGPWERLEAAMSAHLASLLDGGDYAQVVTRELPRDDGPARRRLIGMRDDYETIFRGLVDALPLPPETSRRHLRLMLFGAMNWTQHWYRPAGDTPEAIARAFVSVLRKGDQP